MNLSTVKWAQWDKTQSRELLVCSHVCALHCAQLLCTILHRIDLIVFPLNLQTITIAPMISHTNVTCPKALKNRIIQICATSSVSLVRPQNRLGPLSEPRLWFGFPPNRGFCFSFKTDTALLMLLWIDYHQWGCIHGHVTSEFWKMTDNVMEIVQDRDIVATIMWASVQRDGRPAKYRWRPLFNAAKFDWRPLLECRAVTLPRRETRWNLQGCPKLPNRSQPLVGRSSPCYENMWRRYCCVTGFFANSDICLSCEDTTQHSCAMVPRWPFFASFLRPVSLASHVQHIWDLHPKFALRPHRV